MIWLSIRSTLFSRESEEMAVSGITIPEWDEVGEVPLLHSIGYYTDAVFNEFQLDALASELERWRDFEATRSDRDARVERIEDVIRAVDHARKRGSFAVFLGA